MNAKLKIKNQYQNFKKGNLRIADFILEKPEEFLKMTAVEIAEHCQTSSASVIRFIKNLNYDGLNEFKLQLSRELAEENLELEYSIDMIVQKEDTIDVICQKMKSMIKDTNNDLFQVLDLGELRKAIDRICMTRRINLLGIGASMLPAYDLYHKLRRINMDARYEFDTHMSVEFTNFDTKEDTVIAFSYSGLSKEIIYPCEIAKKNGACIIAVTRDAPSQLRDLADIVLSVPDTEHLTRIGAFSSRYASMEIADILYLGALQKSDNMYEEELVGTSKLTRKLKNTGGRTK